MPHIHGLPTLITLLFTPMMELRSVCASPVSQTHRQAQMVRGSVSSPLDFLLSSSYSTDADRTCYTGAICGLGWNSRFQEAIFPEHDMEIVFDVKFDVEDITEAGPVSVIA